MQDYLQSNRDTWDKRTQIHIRSKFYDVAGFLAGKTSLQEIERAELVDVAGKKLLHLQCHFGLDTLSWARKGAIVTGVDLSPIAIEQAQSLATQAGLQARFICADVFDFGLTVHADYDIVFTSYGTICWLPCLTQWAHTIANSLKPGGVFYMADFHPIFDLISGYTYFHSVQADVEEEGTYTENCNGETTTTMTWAHAISDILNALINAGISITTFNEFTYSPYNCFDGLTERESGRYYASHCGNDVPLVYSITGIKNR